MTNYCEWGEQGIQQLAPHCDVIIIVDVLSFSTSVDIACSRGASVYPYRGDAPHAYADSLKAILADHSRTPGAYSLSPASLRTIPPDTRLVLPSLNGSTLSLSTGTIPTMAGCLRNAKAVAHAAQQIGATIAVIPAGERWKADGTLRPAIEDWLGAGAILSYLAGDFSPEAELAVATFHAAQPKLEAYLLECASGQELIERGFRDDVQLAAQLNASECAPILKHGCYSGL